MPIVNKNNSKRGRHPREYASWNAMKQRCDNPNTPCYYNYGGRGITYCDRWAEFENFLSDMGDRPQDITTHINFSALLERGLS